MSNSRIAHQVACKSPASETLQGDPQVHRLFVERMVCRSCIFFCVPMMCSGVAFCMLIPLLLNI